MTNSVPQIPHPDGTIGIDLHGYFSDFGTDVCKPTSKFETILLEKSWCCKCIKHNLVVVLAYVNIVSQGHRKAAYPLER